MKSTNSITLIIYSISILLVSSYTNADEHILTEIKVNARLNDAFEPSITHPISKVPVTIVDAEFGEKANIVCSKTSRQGQSTCRLAKNDCNEANSGDSVYEIQLQQYFDGYFLENNSALLSIVNCSFELPDSHSFLYEVENFIVYKKSNNRINTTLTSSNLLINGFSQGSPDFIANVSAFANFTTPLTPTDITTLITDSNNLVQYYVKIANLYDTGNDEYIKYQKRAKSFERFSVLTANIELKRIAQMTYPDKPITMIKVSPSLKDYVENISRLRLKQSGNSVMCANCNNTGYVKKLNRFTESEELNAKAVASLKEISIKVRKKI